MSDDTNIADALKRFNDGLAALARTITDVVSVVKREYPELLTDSGRQRFQLTIDTYGVDEIRAVASRLGKNIVGGKDKLSWMSLELAYRLTFGCPYCLSRIYFDNAVADHKDPIGAVRRASGSQGKAHADRRENIHIIDIRCNNIKGDLTDEEFRLLIHLLNQHDMMKRKLERRLQQSRTFYKTMWANKKARGYKRR